MSTHDFPDRATVYKYFQKWEHLGIWQKIHHTLRHQLREKLGRKQNSTVAIADSQSIKTTEKRGRSTDTMVARRSKVVNDI